MLGISQPAGSMNQPKRSRPDETPGKKEKEPKLPPECRIPIFKFLPTSELVRFVSKTRPLLGEYWSHELKFVVEQRLPFGVYLDRVSIFINFFERRMNVKFDLGDCLGNKIADIKHPELFQFSPLCELAEHTYLPARFHATNLPLGALFGYDLLAPLVNLRSLALLFIRNSPGGSTELPLQMSSLSPAIQQVLSQVESLKLLGRPCDPPSINTHLLHGLENLKRLDVGLEEFCAIMPVMVPFKRLLDFWTLPQDGADTLMRLDSLSISIDDILKGYGYYKVIDFYYSKDCPEWLTIIPIRQMLHFLGAKCVRLSELSLPLIGEMSLYTQAFRAMPNLAKLALDARLLESNGFIEHEEPITTVKELSIAGQYGSAPSQQAMLLSVLAKFPRISSLSIRIHNIYETWQLAADVLSRHLFPCLASLECIFGGADHFFKPRELTLLLENPNLPLRVEILPSESFAFVAKDPDFLVTLYSIMKTNPAQFLLMKGPFHPQALVRLKEVISEDRKIEKMAKVLAWTDKDLPRQRGIARSPELAPPDFTDVKISGVKNAGPKKGEEFTIRICHQHTDIISYIV